MVLPCRLTATFQVSLPEKILVKSDGRPLTFSNQLGSFAVSLTILQAEDGPKAKAHGERHWTYSCRKFSIVVSREEPIPPPDIESNARGSRDFSSRSKYFASLEAEYSQAAREVLCNAVAFLKYRLHQRSLRAGDLNLIDLGNPEWQDEKDASIEPGRLFFKATVLTPSALDFGVVKLEGKHKKALQAALVNGVEASLYEEILSDAQAAAMAGNIRRAVLEMAIACEVFAKQTFLGRDDGSAQVFEALEDRGRIGLRTLELIDVGGEALLGSSFRSFDKMAQTDLDHLFRARNKVAHRGDPVFRDDGGRLHRVDRKRLARWWVSVEKLFAWASSKPVHSP